MGGTVLDADEVWRRYERLLRWRQARPDTIHSYDVALHSLWAHLDGRGVRWDRLTPDDVEEWLAGRCHTGKRNAGKRYSPGTRNKYGARVATFYAQATLEGWIKGRNPLAGWRPPRRPAARRRALKVSAITQLLTELADDRRLAMIVLIGYHQGLRIGEVCRLRVEDIMLDTDPPAIYVQGKGGQDAEMDLSAALIPGLRAWLLTRPASGPLIPNYRFPGEHLSPRYAATLLARAMRPVVGDSFHALRRTTAQQLRILTHDPFLIRDALRHSSLETLDVYVEREPELVAAALGSLPDPQRQEVGR
jgi:integrase